MLHDKNKLLSKRPLLYIYIVIHILVKSLFINILVLMNYDYSEE